MQRLLFPCLSVAVWVAVWAFWLVVTRSFHPSQALAVVVTTSLVVAYATATYINHLILVPRLRATGHRGRYVAWLLGTMLLLTGIALAVIRVAYLNWWGPDADPNGLYKHYVIDLFGMAVHLLVAEGVIVVGRRFGRPRMPNGK